MSKTIAITGTIASGKSLVGKLLCERGFPVIDTDAIVHDLFQTEGLKADILRAFGPQVSDSHGGIDRIKLGSLVFANEADRRKLEAIVHPATIAECRRQISQLKNQPIVFVLVPLLFEVGLQDQYDEVWTVVTREAILRERLKQRNQLSDAEIDKRLAAQLSQEEKSRRSQQIIDNSGTIADTSRQIDQLLNGIAA